jgi:hypothetical protein
MSGYDLECNAGMRLSVYDDYHYHYRLECHPAIICHLSTLTSLYHLSTLASLYRLSTLASLYHLSTLTSLYHLSTLHVFEHVCKACVY